jgi:hypothetical protein
MSYYMKYIHKLKSKVVIKVIIMTSNSCREILNSNVITPFENLNSIKLLKFLRAKFFTMFM